MIGCWRTLQSMAKWRFTVALCVLATMAACTTLPNKEFTGYKETFAQARSAGEQVLMDYGAAVSNYDDAVAQDEAANPSPRPRPVTFSAAQAQRQADHVDHIGVRMKAWEVVARYNDLLTALAEGNNVDALLSAVDGFSDSLGAFPVAAVKLASVQVQAYLAPLRPLAKEALREKSRRDFVAAVAKGAPYIEGNFLELLRADAEDFYRVRKGLNDLEYRPLLSDVRARAKRIGKLLPQTAKADELVEPVQKFNARLAALPLNTDGAAPVAPLELDVNVVGTQASGAALEALEEATTAADQALAKNEALHAYRDVLVAHVALLDQLGQSLAALRMAAEQAQPTIPHGDDLRRKVIMLREAYIAYKDKL